MNLIKTIVNRPVAIFILFLLIIGIGIYIVRDIPIDLFPEIEPPMLLVTASYPGAGPEEVEKTVTRILEGTLSNVSGIKEITSTSSEGHSMIRVEFNWGTDLSEATNEVRDKLELVKDMLPDKAGTAQIFKFDTSMIPILELAMRGDRSPEEMRRIAEDIVQPRIEQVDGVALTALSGGRERMVRVEVSQNRLEAYGLTLTQVAAQLAANNVELGGGSITEGDTNFLIRTSGEYSSIDEIENTVVTYRGSGDSTLVPVKLRDIAAVYDGFEDEESTVYINGKPGVYVMVQKQSGENSVRVAETVRERIDTINAGLPRGVQVEVVGDTTRQIKNAISQVISSALWGLLFAVGILFFFLRRIKATLIVGLAIPIALLVTMMCLYFSGLTLNMMTLAGLALGIGMVVDSSIVILENIHRYRERGAKLKLSAILGSKEMINAIVASTLTTICVFIPMIMLKGKLEMMGVLFTSFALVIIIALVAALLVALFLVPVLSSKFLPLQTSRQKQVKSMFLRKIDNGMESMLRGLERVYKRALGVVLNHKLITIMVVVLIFAGGIMLAPRAGFTLMSESKEDTVEVNVELPLGTTLEVTERILRELELIVKNEIPAYEDILIDAGSGGFMGSLFGGSNSHKGSITVILPDYDERAFDSDMVKAALRTHFNDFPGARLSFDLGHNMSRMFIGNPIDIVVKSNDLDRGRDAAAAIQRLLTEKVPEATEPDISMEDGLPEMEIIIDRQRAALFGLTVSQIGNELNGAVDGITATQYRSGGDEYDVFVVLSERDRSSVPDLEKIFVSGSTGLVPLSNVASIMKSEGPVDISREDQTRVIHVTAGLLPGVKTNDVQERIENLIGENIIQDEELAIEYGGDIGSLMKYLPTMAAIVVIALFLVYGVMAAQFESFKDPFIMFFTIPTMLIGVIGMNLITGDQITLFSMVGVVMLFGVVVNTGIVLVDYTNLLRERGLSIREACIEAGGHRLRPILMTTFTTILAMVPMGFFPGEGAEMVQPIGRTVIGGLGASMVMTLFLIPVLYAVFNRNHGKKRVEAPVPKASRVDREREEVYETA